MANSANSDGATGKASAASCNDCVVLNNLTDSSCCPTNSSSFTVVNLGCKVNRAESDYFIERLSLIGALYVRELTEADLIIINTCTVTGEAEAKTRQAIRRALAAAGPGASVVATGCAVQMSDGYYREFGSDLSDLSGLPGSTSFPTKRLHLEADRNKALELAESLLCDSPSARAILHGPNHSETSKLGAVVQCDSNIQSSQVALVSSPGDTVSPRPILPALRKRQVLKIQDGCDEQCSYCIVSTARGPARSLPAHELVKSACQSAGQGLSELVLTGINLGKYVSEGLNLSGLMQSILMETEGMRLRLSSIESNDITPELLDCIAANKGKVCAHLHMPLQSGSDEVLRRMNRPYTSGNYMECVKRARNALPGLALSTDIIVGFPGETESDFQRTIRLCEQAGFMRTHVFRYSLRKGTPAAEMPDQIAPEVKAERSQRLRDLAAQLTRCDLERRVGTNEPAVVEEKGWARTESYHRVAIDPSHQPGETIKYHFPNQL
ncbi:MAG: MiaB/RimO family radical SAM methylthiotransferase [Coriobacteriales bacterium]|jgi:threonylcarbamoyladenosine tRNA methylthiotransferase MtaB|nr:MiaB/RimO family radical SAM methylthiotransferase [Coriobacteriales bacterium]